MVDLMAHPVPPWGLVGNFHEDEEVEEAMTRQQLEKLRGLPPEVGRPLQEATTAPADEAQLCTECHSRTASRGQLCEDEACRRARRARQERETSGQGTGQAPGGRPGPRAGTGPQR